MFAIYSQTKRVAVEIIDIKNEETNDFEKRFCNRFDLCANK
jgi:hypothetical protein